MEHGRKKKIGTIEVVRLACMYLRTGVRDSSGVVFDQANKKDASDITGGQYTMSTTKKGKVVESLKQQEECEYWQHGDELGRLTVEYRMAHTLQV